MFGDGGRADREGLHQFLDRRFALRETGDNGPAHGMAEGGEGGVERI
jgi:hypothetical protein